MKSTRLFPLLCCLLSLYCAPCSLLASSNAQPWDEQEAERDAQEEITSSEKSAQEEMSSSVYGRITNINMEEKTLSLIPTDEVENKEEEDDDNVVAEDFHFASDTPLTGLDELSELAPGDYVTLEYYTFRDKNRITEISFDKPEEESEAATTKTSENPTARAIENSSAILVG